VFLQFFLDVDEQDEWLSVRIDPPS
jgi:hypothetical protein